jgi:hypothetical protein
VVPTPPPVFAERPERILQELVDVAMELCGADSAGVSVEEPGEQPAFRWAATSGKYVPFQNARLPYDFAPCSICLERGEPQHFRVGQAFFDLLGVPAELVTLIHVTYSCVRRHINPQE